MRITPLCCRTKNEVAARKQIANDQYMHCYHVSAATSQPFGKLQKISLQSVAENVRIIVIRAASSKKSLSDRWLKNAGGISERRCRARQALMV